MNSNIKAMIAEKGCKPKTVREWLKYNGVGKVAIRELHALGWVIENDPEWAAGLSVRATNIVARAEIHSKEQLREFVQNGTLRPGKRDYGYDAITRNYGWQTHREVCAWLGMPLPKPEQKLHKCPHCGNNLILGVGVIKKP